MLCYRCEMRARFLEKGYGPRMECGDIRSSKIACYMYLPCKPLITTKLDKSDPRPEHGGYFGSRMKAEDLYEGGLIIKDLGDGKSVLLYT